MSAEYWPAYWTAWLTLGLLVVAAVTAVFGLVGLYTANGTLRLEAMPYLVVTQASILEYVGQDLQTLVLSTEDGGAAGASACIRRYTSLWDKHDFGLPHVTVADPRWTDSIVAIKNVGRSPAVDVALPLTLQFDANPRYVYDPPNTRGLDKWEAGRDYPLPPPTSTHRGEIRLTAVMPGETVTLRVQNRFGCVAWIQFDGVGNSADGLRAGRRTRVPIAAAKRICIVHLS